MRERPILFSGPMVRAILEGRKTQTRRVVDFRRAPGCASDCAGKLPERSFADRGFPDQDGKRRYAYLHVPCKDEAAQRFFCPYGMPGDRLWVRERWSHDGGAGAACADHRCGIADHVWYYATEDERTRDTFAGSARWRPSIHMPRWASRLTLEITEVRVQRLQEISEEDAKAEGARYFPGIPAGPYGDNGTRWSMRLDSPPDTDHCLRTARLAFGQAWNDINGKRAAWSSNPWVWALTFRRLP
jgi:hypothetical protein